MRFRKTGSEVSMLTTVIVCVVAILIDIALVMVLKDKSSTFRWLWLPLISLALSLISSKVLFSLDDDSLFAIIWCWIMVVWSVIRGLIVVVAYFKASSGLGILGAVFLCLFMWCFNTIPFAAVGGAFLWPDGDGSTPTPSSRPTTVSRPRSTASYATEKKPSPPRQGDLSSYFRSYACAPQSGSMYFWQSSPSMSSSFGSHSSYTITGTIGIRKQSIEAFHVTSTDMDHYLSSVERDVDSYVDEIIRDYRHDYPDDPTDFSVSINLRLEISG